MPKPSASLALPRAGTGLSGTLGRLCPGAPKNSFEGSYGVYEEGHWELLPYLPRSPLTLGECIPHYAVSPRGGANQCGSVPSPHALQASEQWQEGTPPLGELSMRGEPPGMGQCLLPALLVIGGSRWSTPSRPIAPAIAPAQALLLIQLCSKAPEVAPENTGEMAK